MAVNVPTHSRLGGQVGERNQGVWMDALMREAWAEARDKVEAERLLKRWQKYQDDPVGFCEDVFGDRFTVDIEKVMRSVVENPVTIVRSATDVGKSHGAARIACWFYLVHETAQVYLTAAPPLDNLKRILWGEVMSVVRKHEGLFAGHKIRAMAVSRDLERQYRTGSDEKEDLKNSFMTCVTIPAGGTPEERETKFSGKHAPYMLFVVDEGDAVPWEIYRGIEGCMSGGIMPRLLVLFNPRNQSGILYDMEIGKRAHVVEMNALNHPNVYTGVNKIHGAVTRDTIVRRINEWTRPLKPEEVGTDEAENFQVPEFLVGEVAQSLDGQYYQPLEGGTRRVVEPSFHYMVMGHYPPQGDTQLISQDWINAARARWDAYVAMFGEVPPLGVRPILGADVADLGGDWNSACLRYGGYVSKFVTWQGMDVEQSADKLVGVYKAADVEIAMIDATGVGSGVAPMMARRGRSIGLRAVSVKVVAKPLLNIKTEMGEFFCIRDQLWWAVREWLRTDKGAMIPPDRSLIEELSMPSYNLVNGQIRVSDKDEMRARLRRSPDRADALCLTFYPVTRAKVLAINVDRTRNTVL